jgi:hypothetical protein
MANHRAVRCDFYASENEERRTQGDYVRTIFRDFVASLKQVEFPTGFNLEHAALSTNHIV